MHKHHDRTEAGVLDSGALDQIHQTLEEVWGKPLRGAVAFPDVVLLNRRLKTTNIWVSGYRLLRVSQDYKWPDTLHVQLNDKTGGEVDVRLPLGEAQP